MIAHPKKIYTKFTKKFFIIGFGTVGQGVLPLLLRHIDIQPAQITIINKNSTGKEVAENHGVHFCVSSLTQENYQTILLNQLNEGDFLLNVSVDVSSLELIKLCQKTGTLYLDTCIEPWAGGYLDPALSSAQRSNYMLRQSALALKTTSKKSTAVLTHGANPGLVSHLVKQALLNMAKDTALNVPEPTTREAWAALAYQLNIKVIHIAERDTQVTKEPKRIGEFLNTWSVDGFISEGSQPAELGWGTHEKQMPADGHQHEVGSKCAIYLNRPGASTRVRTWTPKIGAFHGFLITHSEAISIADYFTVKKDEHILYRPTVHYAYHPCENAVLSLHEFAGREWNEQEHKKVLFDEIIDGDDELGVLLMGNAKGAYWYGSELSIQAARELAPFNNATSLQVVASVLGGVIWAIENPQAGVVEPEEMDFKYVLDIALPYLGKVHGRYTNWTPLQEREKLFAEDIDKNDPWQFINIRVS